MWKGAELENGSRLLGQARNVVGPGYRPGHGVRACRDAPPGTSDPPAGVGIGQPGKLAVPEGPYGTSSRGWFAQRIGQTWSGAWLVPDERAACELIERWMHAGENWDQTWTPMPVSRPLQDCGQRRPDQTSAR
jgi:hypothetical protein